VSGPAFRPATDADLPDLAALERACFARPWPATMLAAEVDREGAIVEIALGAAGAVLGYTCAWLVDDECHVLRIATAPDARRRGIAREGLARLLAWSRAQGCARVLLEVESRNEPARRLYLDAGFQEVGRRPGYYGDDDAVLMTWRP
jgi:ribosomal-protein-alanine N-acetyltransferase